MVPSTLLFESGIMKISDYDPIKDKYQIRTLQLPNLPLLENLELSPLLVDNNNNNNTIDDSNKMEISTTTTTSSSTDTIIHRKKPSSVSQNTSRFTECFELTCIPTVFNESIPTPSSTLRSSKSVTSKKASKSIYNTKTPRRCYSNPNLSKKNTMMDIEPLDPTLVTTMMKNNKTSTIRTPKRSLSNAFHVLSGLLPKNKRRLDISEHDSKQGDDGSIRTIGSSSSTIRQAWVGTTWVDEMKTCDLDSRQRFSSKDETRSWWQSTLPSSLLSSVDVCM
ncbi:uncharacterized protein BX664DRAFT_340989 [Halteromyces radiatus]|uniref:uncharacterized protein n=1 Tax=Halteromyces radiatus TaxID=101107 RepID=UPI002220158C|nr:uncharacterized protein BX664DRAFT_340989 [Halteromyces radiatus]KAI8081677.1 hypothetical protein BX664DRAFT_340989 [Halteromyces radiatus]